MNFFQKHGTFYKFRGRFYKFRGSFYTILVVKNRLFFPDDELVDQILSVFEPPVMSPPALQFLTSPHVVPFRGRHEAKSPTHLA
jgi:hypothetical protein